MPIGARRVCGGVSHNRLHSCVTMAVFATPRHAKWVAAWVLLFPLGWGRWGVEWDLKGRPCLVRPSFLPRKVPLWLLPKSLGKAEPGRVEEPGKLLRSVPEGLVGSLGAGPRAFPWRRCSNRREPFAANRPCSFPAGGLGGNVLKFKRAVYTPPAVLAGSYTASPSAGGLIHFSPGHFLRACPIIRPE